MTPPIRGRLIQEVALVFGFATALSLGACSDGSDSPGGGGASVAALEASASNGDAASQYALGKRYEHGDGVVQDFVSAHVYYNLASAQGYPGAAVSRDAIAARMTPEQLAEAQGRAADWSPQASRRSGEAWEASDEPGAAMLLAAAHAGELESVRRALEQGVDVDGADAEGWTALIVSANSGHLDVVRLLLEAGADPNRAAKDGTTALHAAVVSSSHGVVEALLEAGADASAKAQGVTPAQLARAGKDGSMDGLFSSRNGEDAPSGGDAGSRSLTGSELVIDEMAAVFRALKKSNVRKGPSTEFPVVTQLEPGERVTVTGRVQRNGWYQVVNEEGVAGYVYPALVVTETEFVPRGMVEIPAGNYYSGCFDENFADFHSASGGFDSCSGEENGELRYLPTFVINRHEVTVAEYRACVAAGACREPEQSKYCTDDEDFNSRSSARANHPVNCISLMEAQAYCQWRGFRLPTRWEWEKAARGEEDRRRYPWGKPPLVEWVFLDPPDESYTIDAQRGLYLNMHVPYDTYEKEDPEDGYAQQTAPVGSFPAGASPYGLLDMLGNVSEMVVPAEAREDSGIAEMGGSYLTHRFEDLAVYKVSGGVPGSWLGFRCAR
ncbi:MAG: SUMF1/EgtB/PvdO family nonheme iron enzyme [bacterium]